MGNAFSRHMVIGESGREVFDLKDELLVLMTELAKQNRVHDFR